VNILEVEYRLSAADILNQTWVVVNFVSRFLSSQPFSRTSLCASVILNIHQVQCIISLLSPFAVMDYLFANTFGLDFGYYRLCLLYTETKGSSKSPCLIRLLLWTFTGYYNSLF